MSTVNMNMFQGHEWDTLMLGYETEFEKNDRADTEITTLTSKLMKLLEKKSALFWHIKSFDRYNKEKINPLGLRVQIFPNVDSISSECKTEWEANLNACSQQMMVILTKEYTRQIALLDKEICILEKALQPFASHALFVESRTKLRADLSFHNKSILGKKEAKYWRDKFAFSEGRAYKWNTNTPPHNNTSGKVHPATRNTTKSKAMPNSNEGAKSMQKPRGKFKRNRSNKDSPEGNSKKRITDNIPTESSSTYKELQATSHAVLAPLDPPYTYFDEMADPVRSNGTCNERGREIMLSSMEVSQKADVTNTNGTSSGKNRENHVSDLETGQNSLNPKRGFPSPRLNKGVGNLDAFVTRIQANPSV
ncbi:uncharacterized protein LOC143960693 [Lithobates pipiens]